MASVFEAVHEKLDKTVALKVLHPHVAANPRAVARFLIEGRAAARIRHPHAVSVFDAGTTSDGTPYLAMELERGETLASWVRAFGSLDPRQTVDLMLPVLSAIQHAHSLGIVHRDLKPANILIGSDHLGEPVPKIADFGISRFNRPGNDDLLTGEGGLLGTLAYMAPEQISAPHEAEAAADQYSAGVVLYECLTGRRPFETDNAKELRHLVLHAPVPPLRSSHPGIPVALEAVVLRAMDKEVAGRFSTIGDFARALLPFSSEHTFLVYSRDFADSGLIHRLPSSHPRGGTQDEPLSAELEDFGEPTGALAPSVGRSRLWLVSVLLAAVAIGTIAVMSFGRSPRGDVPLAAPRALDDEKPAMAAATVLGVPPEPPMENANVRNDIEDRRTPSNRSRPQKPSSSLLPSLPHRDVAGATARPAPSASSSVHAGELADDFGDPRLDRR